MTQDQSILVALLLLIWVLFLWGRWRYDVVAMLGLLVATVAGVVPASAAFSGFAHPATITVAMVLILGRGLQNAGAVDIIVRRLLPPQPSPSRQVGVVASVAGLLSTVMNNVGALALLMPAVLRSSAKAKQAPATVLMPLSFAAILGGLVTLIGTPPNIIIASFRQEVSGVPFGMFDFTPVGGVVAFAGVLFISVVGWRLIPGPRRARLNARELFTIDGYVSELRIKDDSKSIGMKLSELDALAAEHDTLVLAVLRGRRRIDRAGRFQTIRAGDILLIEAEVESLEAVMSVLQAVHADSKPDSKAVIGRDDTLLMEAVVLPRSRLEGRTKDAIRFRRRYGISVLAVSRRGQPFRGPLRTFRFRSGDVLLLEGDAENMPDIIATLGCLPLADRGLVLGNPRRALASIGIFGLALVVTVTGIVPFPVALTAGACAMVLLNIVPARDIYDCVDWPVIVLLGAMLPLGTALQATGTSSLVANAVIDLSAGLPAEMILAVLMIAAMTLSDVMNNAATSVIMAPTAVAVARGLDANVEPFLMAVAVGASCAFLTPIGHQNNTLIMGPGGYRFGDYWRLGLPLEAVVIAVALPAILWVWPL